QSAISDRDSAQTERTAMDRVEAILNGLGESNLGTTITDLFKAFSDIQNSPDDNATRATVIQRGVTLTEAIQTVHADLIRVREDLNTDIVEMTKRINVIAAQVADLNVQITAADAGAGGGSGPLRDQRNALLQELSSFVNITTREQPQGAINVFIGNESLVMYGVSRDLKTDPVAIGGGLTDVVVRFADDNKIADIKSGRIAGAIEARDKGVSVQFTRLNQLASAIIQEVNKRHASGQGLQGFTGLTGTYDVNDFTVPLNNTATGLDFVPKSGSFYIDVKNEATGQSVRYQINIDLDGLNSDDTTLNSLVSQINSVIPGTVTASVTTDGRLQLTATTGSSFTFADDRSNVLAALGLNTFFDGSDASDISVNALVANSPSMIAAASNNLPGDGSNAGTLAGAVDAPVMLLSGVSITDFHQTSTSQSAVDANAAGNALNAAGVIFDGLTAQRESVSGVNLDEEAVRLITYQRSFQAAAQYLVAVDEMLQTLLSLVR
ncbi:MAG: flagellar basal body rod C-terminal domain-containing protein, partial [Phycisphaerae bacterium]